MSASCRLRLESPPAVGVDDADGTWELLAETFDAGTLLLMMRRCCGSRPAESITLALKLLSCCWRYDIVTGKGCSVVTVMGLEKRGLTASKRLAQVEQQRWFCTDM